MLLYPVVGADSECKPAARHPNLPAGDCRLGLRLPVQYDGPPRTAEQVAA